jgi:hypothetical protein
MFFDKKPVSPSKFCQDFHWPCLDKINEDFTSEILENLQHQPFKTEKNKQEIELEVGIFLNHIAGKLAGQTKVIQDPYSPEALSFGEEMFEYFYTRWGENKSHDEFVTEVKKKYKDKVEGYQTYEIAFSQDKMRLEDLEACIAVILLGVKYEELTNSFVKVVEELHKGSTAIISEVFKTFAKKFILLNKAVN